MSKTKSSGGQSTWSPLTHKIYRSLRRQNIEGLHLGVAVSGGADSVALLLILQDLAGALRLTLDVLHVHHGRPSKFRDRAEAQAGRLAGQLGLPFHRKESTLILKSEKELRDFRRQCMSEWKRELALDLVVTAHHADDLLETRIMRLIRGTGRQGLRAIPPRRGFWLRPLLETTHAELVQELRDRKATWLEDPSNKNTRFFRNWLRKVWLPQLDKRTPGALRRMAISLDNLTFSTQTPQTKDVFLAGNTLSRHAYLALSVSEQKQSLADLFFRLKTTNYSQNQIEEVRKRLDSSRIQHTFTVSGLRWNVNAEQISVSKATEALD